MARRTLTDRYLKAVKPDENRKLFEAMDSVVPGLGVRVFPSGRRTFIFVGRFPGSSNPTRRALGEYGAIDLDGARDRARYWHELLRTGKDPADVEEAERLAQARKRENSFAAVAEDFLRLAVVGSDRERPLQRKGIEVERDLRREFISRWGARPVTEITPHDVVAVLDAAVARGARYQAHNLLGHVRRLFNWAIARGVYGIESSPCDRMKPRDVIGKKALRKRILDEREIFAQWRASGRMSYPFGHLFQLLILTGQRKSEVAEARWREFHPELVRLLRGRGEKAIDWAKTPQDWKIWTIPAARMKADAPHLVPLTDDALAILAQIPHVKKGDYLFSTTFGEKPVAGFSKAKNRLDREMLRTMRAQLRTTGEEWRSAELEPFVLHDLRRTMRTGLSSLPIPDLVRELVIAHTKRGLHKVYDQHAYLDEKRHALELWSKKLGSIVNPRENEPISLTGARGFRVALI